MFWGHGGEKRRRSKTQYLREVIEKTETPDREEIGAFSRMRLLFG
jgi:hypothetical protein